MSQQQTQVQLSPEAYKRLQDELEDLTTRGRVEVAARIEAARALGDLKENGDYHAAKDDQGKMEARVRQIEAMLKNASIVDAPVSSGEVVAGSVVALRYDGDDDAERYLIGSIEEKRSDIDGVISPGSPLGQAVLGKRAGETVEYDAPGGKLKVEIVEIGV
jgi:transcription elongation factor GreA